jgi:hypothetical protein
MQGWSLEKLQGEMKQLELLLLLLQEIKVVAVVVPPPLLVVVLVQVVRVEVGRELPVEVDLFLNLLARIIKLKAKARGLLELKHGRLQKRKSLVKVVVVLLLLVVILLWLKVINLLQSLLLLLLQLLLRQHALWNLLPRSKQRLELCGEESLMVR